MASSGHWLSELVRDIDDFPTKGVSFRDITPLLGDGKGFARAVDALADKFADVAADTALWMAARCRTMLRRCRPTECWVWRPAASSSLLLWRTEWGRGSYPCARPASFPGR